MPIILQVFFFDFLRKSQKRGSYQQPARLSRTEKRSRQEPVSKVAKFAEFQSFNVFKQRIPSTYQQTIHHCGKNHKARNASKHYFCNFIFTINNFTFSLHSSPSIANENNAGTPKLLLLHFLQALFGHINYFLSRCGIGIKKENP